MVKKAENEEISIDLETGEEIELEENEVTNSALKNKLKKLRKELQDTKKERDENLAGWQRSKADLVNFRKTIDAERVKNDSRSKGVLIRNILPALDTFDTAMQDKAWNDVDKKWREGVERIAKQLHNALEAEGLETFGTIGEVFDPSVHECMSMSMTDKKKEDHTITQVLQNGYRINNELVRPAKVVVAEFKSKT